ncbi:hypothetical protein CORC01_12876 [Colletotrichum orchidophilum]|uniref:DUF6604 domain-containing protein n=1 Tax=Colletotrichum orchidophilum TaxID=1209926 RepID=A0A1G4AS00_9PEZI|nr:uncharacterized protein CORC01_12876 [Colletotrichum orchidophilum]OHE91802.1 hypothetical protein CORC01_12876 [Colletotrichum orchidophilum]
MATQNAFAVYKRDARHLAYWMVRASNFIIKTPTAKLVKKHLDIPPAIFRLFRSVIDARTAHLTFLRRVVTQEDPQFGKDIEIHETFIHYLKKAFVALGGDAWTESQQPGGEKNRHATSKMTAEELTDAIQFSALDILALSLESSDENSSDADGSSITEPSTTGSQRRARKKSGRGGKGKKKIKAPSAALNVVSIEEYSIDEADGGLEAEYFMASCAIAKECVSLREYLQGIWHEAAYCGLHGSIAGALSKLAIEMIRSTESDIFSEISGLHSYETCMMAITRSNLEIAQSAFNKALINLTPVSQQDGLKATFIDLKEYIQLGTYRDLVDFIEDYQQTRNGRPTEKMLAKIKYWDPTLDLQRVTKKERLKWRRSYTINWLYDLVNSFACGPLTALKEKSRVAGQGKERQLQLEDVDWLPNGPLITPSVILGLQEFASFVATLAMKKPGTDVRPYIMPHHVFQLQCIVDAFTVSCGWSNNTRWGHVLVPPSSGSRGPMKDIDGFLGCRNVKNGKEEYNSTQENNRSNKYNSNNEENSGNEENCEEEEICFGFLQSADLLAHILEADDPESHKGPVEFLGEFCKAFDFLGQSIPMDGNILPNSRFNHTGPNGLWRYSPFLCGVGLMEGLEMTYRMSMLLWDTIQEPVTMVHLHNNLVQHKHIGKPLAHYQLLQDMFPDGFFLDGHVPLSNFADAFLGIRELMWGAGRSKQQVARPAHEGFHRAFDLDRNLAFRRKSNLLLYREANWNVDWIPDNDLNPRTSLALLRAAQRVAEPHLTGKTDDERNLLGRVKAALDTDDEGLTSRMQSLLKQTTQVQSHQSLGAPSNGMEDLEKSASSTGAADMRPGAVSPKCIEPTRVQILNLVKRDLQNDVCGTHAYSTINYVLMTVNMLDNFKLSEIELERAHDPGYVSFYKYQNIPKLAKRTLLVDGILREHRETAGIKTVVKALESRREVSAYFP